MKVGLASGEKEFDAKVIGTDPATDTAVLKAKNGDVTFNHKKHSADPASCKACHGDTKPGKLTMDKDAAHKLCKGCHDAKKAGPTKCGECHKK